ncbi:hypothetical protein JI739_19120 [Ramlibacter sp. AW1]|uniref:Uncharacterized protein n=1 Tax=Ramlibacter aurantiacus TaxID=2801330 RepID=A0A937D6M6_9BURK|nr:hypothetical protein [Ramlibacter aurantiacus]MBL0422467.1 hypothetical protein [Ramlibacter aurantiacus]
MGLLDQLYEAAANAGFLKQCTWRPSTGAPAQTHLVGFDAPDGTVFDGLTTSTDYVMSYPDTAFTALSVRENVEIGGMTFQVREVRAIGDGSEMRAKLTRL